MYWFQLWREFKLSIVEILAVFPEWKTVCFSKQVLIVDWLNKEILLKNCKKMWWIINVFEMNEIEKKNISNEILEKAKLKEWKFKYWLNLFWWNLNLKEILNKTKKILKENSVSSRFVNKDFKNLSSAQILWEKLVEKETDFNLVINNDRIYFWRTIWVQDINEYSKRDYWKDRDMQTWMLPPKLAQMMINLWGGNVIYDPFVWLGTVLIESIIAWNTEVYWSDLNEKMIESTEKNLGDLIKNKKSDKILFKLEKLNAKFIHESSVFKCAKIDSIVTEWYLWEIMTKKNISLERIEKQKETLIKIYKPFFEWLEKIKYKWNVVISFPFWEINGKFIYFLGIYSIIQQCCNIQKFFPADFWLFETKSWSLLYKRDKQLVGREIFKLKIK